MSDDIHSPPHYEVAPGLEAWDVIAATLTEDELRGFCLGNIIKYRLRAGEKGSADTCIAKANWYRQVLRDLEGSTSGADSDATAVVGPCGNEAKTVQGKPSWSDAPEWANWLAQNPWGGWRWFEGRPSPLDGFGWRPYGGRAMVVGITTPVNGDWKDTLEARP